MQTAKTLEPSIVAILLPRLQDEFNAYYFYRAASNWCKSVGFNLAATYFAKESEDELSHAKKIEQFLVDWNVIPALPPINTPILNFTSLGDVINQSYSIEYSLYADYEEDSVKILKTGDICVFDFLKEFRDIQVKSVAEYSDMLNLLQGVNVDGKFEMLLIEEKLF